MNKKEFIEEYGVEAYERKLEQREHNSLFPDRMEANSREASHKGGKYYERQRNYFSTGLPHERKLVRLIHGQRYRPYKKIIAPESQIHHEWIPGTAEYTGSALVETDQHAHGFVDVIQVLEGEITLLTEAEIRGI